MEEQQERSRRRQELQALLSPQQAEAVQLDERLRQEQERQQELQAELAREQQGSGSAPSSSRSCRWRSRSCCS